MNRINQNDLPPKGLIIVNTDNIELTDYGDNIHDALKNMQACPPDHGLSDLELDISLSVSKNNLNQDMDAFIAKNARTKLYHAGFLVNEVTYMVEKGADTIKEAIIEARKSKKIIGKLLEDAGYDVEYIVDYSGINTPIPGFDPNRN